MSVVEMFPTYATMNVNLCLCKCKPI